MNSALRRIRCTNETEAGMRSSLTRSCSRITATSRPSREPK
ncbi:hypothetical protein ACFPRL_13025 [Pseudoclavibacter helvolus]